MSEAKTTAMQTFSGIGMTSFADRDAARTDQIPSFKGSEKRMDRIAIIDPNRVAIGRVHSHFTEKGSAEQGLGYVLCKTVFKRTGDLEVPEKIGVCCQTLQDARKRCGTWVVVYASDPKNAQVTKPVDYKLNAWVFSPKTFDQLATINEEFAERDADGNITTPGLAKVDLLISCEDVEWQRLKITPSPTRVMAHPTFVERYGKSISDWVSAMDPKLPRLVGREYKDEEIVAKAGGAGGNRPSADAPNVTRATVPSEIDSIFE